MNALTYSSYGTSDVLTIKQVPKPTPAPGQVLVKVAAVSVNKGDQVVLNGTPFLVRLATGGITAPKPDTIIGSDFAGTVEALGEGAELFKVGDAVYGQIDFTKDKGTCAEYVCLDETAAIAHKPTNLSFAQAAAIPCAGQTALQALRDDGQLKSGEKVLINGASGGVGSYAIQVAKALGATVTAVCSSANAPNAKKLGADIVIPYDKQDFVDQADKQQDLLVDLVGNRSLRDFRSVMAHRGRYISAGGPPETFVNRMICLLALKPFASQYLSNSMVHPSKALLETLAGFAQEGRLEPLIDTEFPFARAVDAYKAYENGRIKGKLVITFP